MLYIILILSMPQNIVIVLSLIEECSGSLARRSHSSNAYMLIDSCRTHVRKLKRTKLLIHNNLWWVYASHFSSHIYLYILVWQKRFCCYSYLCVFFLINWIGKKTVQRDINRQQYNISEGEHRKITTNVMKTLHIVGRTCIHKLLNKQLLRLL